MIDMHIHTTASDGTDSPERIIEKCGKLGLKLCSICDHDTVDAQAVAIKEAGEKRVKYLTGLELSVIHEGELHILGYGVDIHNKELTKEMEILRQSREGRVRTILEKLGEHNVNITFEDVKKKAHGETLGRPHVALALMEKGYAQDVQDAFVRYLGERGLCYVKRRKLTAQQAISLIKQAGGTPVIAHPKLIKTQDFEALLKEMKTLGMEGIEAYYPIHTDAEVGRYVALAEKYNMLVTEGSDYHGTVKPNSALASEKRNGALLEKSVKFFITKYVN
jgi:predicted metal-dependent phosphoesterase TrpH